MQNPNIDIGTYGIWTATLDAQPSTVAAEAVAELDELGFGAVWIPETVFREPFVHASLLLAGSRRIRVATGIVNRYGRDPLACNAAILPTLFRRLRWSCSVIKRISPCIYRFFC